MKRNSKYILSLITGFVMSGSLGGCGSEYSESTQPDSERVNVTNANPAAEIVAPDRMLHRHVAEIRLGNQVPSDAINANYSVLVSPAQFHDAYTWENSGIMFTLGVDLEGRIDFVSTKSPEFRTDEGIHTGQTLADVMNIEGSSQGQLPGWGHFVRLPSGWNAFLIRSGDLLGPDDVPIDSDLIQFLFKSTAAENSSIRSTHD